MSHSEADGEFEGFLPKDISLAKQWMFADESVIKITSEYKVISITPKRIETNNVDYL